MDHSKKLSDDGVKKNRKSKLADASLGKGMAKDKPRLDLIRAKVSSDSLGRNADLLDSPEADSKVPQLLNLIERRKIDRASKAFSKEKASKKKTKFAEIKQKIEDGFYDNPNQLAELAERLIRRFGLD